MIPSIDDLIWGTGRVRWWVDRPFAIVGAIFGAAIVVAVVLFRVLRWFGAEGF